VAGVVGIKVLGFLKGKATEFVMDRKAKRKRATRDAKCVEIPEVDEERTLHILSLHVYELAEAIKRRDFTCVEVMAVYAKRAYEIGREHFLTADEMFEEALELARKADI
jgi:hypothetical protein